MPTHHHHFHTESRLKGLWPEEGSSFLCFLSLQQPSPVSFPILLSFRFSFSLGPLSPLQFLAHLDILSIRHSHFRHRSTKNSFRQHELPTAHPRDACRPRDDASSGDHPKPRQPIYNWAYTDRCGSHAPSHDACFRYRTPCYKSVYSLQVLLG